MGLGADGRFEPGFGVGGAVSPHGPSFALTVDANHDSRVVALDAAGGIPESFGTSASIQVPAIPSTALAMGGDGHLHVFGIHERSGLPDRQLPPYRLTLDGLSDEALLASTPAGANLAPSGSGSNPPAGSWLAAWSSGRPFVTMVLSIGRDPAAPRQTPRPARGAPVPPLWNTSPGSR